MLALTSHISRAAGQSVESTNMTGLRSHVQDKDGLRDSNGQLKILHKGFQVLRSYVVGGVRGRRILEFSHCVEDYR